MESTEQVEDDDAVVAPPRKSNPAAKPNRAFDEFRRILNEKAPVMSYGWSPAKVRSCKWLIRRIPEKAVGVDVGGTEYLCKALKEKGCDITYFDFVKPAGGFDKYVEDDMFSIIDHFKERSLDFITTRHTMEHSLVPLFQLWCYNRLLKDDGKLFVIVPMYAPKWVWFGTHFSCLPYDTWTMLFYRAGFKVLATDSGSWKPSAADFIEYRFELGVDSRELRLEHRNRPAV